MSSVITGWVVMRHGDYLVGDANCCRRHDVAYIFSPSRCQARRFRNETDARAWAQLIMGGRVVRLIRKEKKT